MAQVFGSTRQCVSLYDFMGNLPGDDPVRAEFLGRVKPYLSWLGDQFPSRLRAAGIGTPWHEEMSRRVHTTAGKNWDELVVPTRGWDLWLCAAGYSFQKEPSECVNALSGAMGWIFSDQELQGLLSKGLLLDGAAAAILIERGLGELVGLRNARFITQAEVLYSMEETTDAEFGLRSGARLAINLGAYRDRLLQGDPAPGARVVSILKNPRHEPVGHGVYVFENSLGGRVGVVPWTALWSGRPMELMLSVQRYAQLQKILAWLGRGGTCGHVTGGAWLTPQFMTDGQLWRGIVWNVNPDAAHELVVHPPSGMGAVTRAVHGDVDGERHGVKVVNNRLTFKKPLHQWETVVLYSDGRNGTCD